MGSEARARLSLWFVIGAALLAFAQVMQDQSYRGPAALGMLFATGLVYGTRRLGRGALASALISAVGLFWYSCLVFEGHLTFYTVPTAESVQALAHNLRSTYSQSLVDYAPVPLRDGYAILLVGATWTAATIAELLTFRWRRPLLAVLLPLTMFAAALVLGTGQGSAFYVLVFLAALFTFWSNEQGHRLRTWGGWVGAGASSGGLARRIGAGCLTAAFIAPILIPGLGEGLVNLPGEGGGGSGRGSGGGGASVDPWVSIVPRLVEQSDEELFRVRARTAAYWRTASLEVFDGLDWNQISTAHEPAEDGVRTQFPELPDDVTESLIQELTVIGLGGDALPAAATPVRAARLIEGGADMSEIEADPQSGAVHLRGSLNEGEIYQVRSEIPRVTYEQLLEAVPADRSSFPAIFYQLPSGLSEQVVALTVRWSRGEETPFEQLVEIQRRLRGFEYSLNPGSTGTHDHLRRFLMETRKGYCQQFATSFALMARILGFPARVSVGFLPGSQDLTRMGFTVRGTDAHAWPEVYFEGHGWIPFEPTPRDLTARPAHTAPTPEQPSLAAGVTDVNRLRGSNTPRDRAEPSPAAGLTGDGAPVSGDAGRDGSGANEGASGWRTRFSSFVAILLLMLVVAALATPLLKTLINGRLYRRAQRAHGRAEAAFIEFQRHAADLAHARRPDESARAFALRLEEAERVEAGSASRLASIYEAAAYTLNGTTDGQAEEARELVRKLRRQMWSSASWWQKVGHVFLLPRTPRPV